MKGYSDEFVSKILHIAHILIDTPKDLVLDSLWENNEELLAYYKLGDMSGAIFTLRRRLLELTDEELVKVREEHEKRRHHESDT